jgi:hypothetical protein
MRRIEAGSGGGVLTFSSLQVPGLSGVPRGSNQGAKNPRSGLGAKARLKCRVRDVRCRVAPRRYAGSASGLLWSETFSRQSDSRSERVRIG